jgi:hypothetical protein
VSPNPRLWCALAVAVAATAGPAPAQVVQGWSHEAASGVNYAYFSMPAAELTVRCKGASVEVVYYLDLATLDPALTGRTSAVLSLVVDNSADLLWTTSNLVVETGIVSLGVGGRAASDLAHDFAGAASSIEVSILTGPPQNDSVQYNREQFPIYGAADAIKAAFAGCGIKF